MNNFVMNGCYWRVRIVHPTDPILIDRTGRLTVATTDPETMTVNLSSYLDGGFKIRVLIHELGHCALYSFGLLDDIHRVVPFEYWIDAEEWVCNFLADYGLKIFQTAYNLIGTSAWALIPQKFEDYIL